ncbi:MAG: response regulator [Magnetococcales bacterium]|nr:response regulator [Magnetococcales bacterium]
MNHPRILLADDNPTNLLLLEEFLRDTSHPCHLPCELRTAKDGRETLTLLESHPEAFDLVLLDIMMPDMDGMEVLARMHLNNILTEIPVIFQTARTSSEEIAAGIDAGAYYYLTKPVDQNQLLTIVRSAFESARFRKRLRHRLASTLAGMTLITGLQLELRTMEEAGTVAELLASAFPDPDASCLGILELLYNAIEHGNLGLTYEDKGRLFLENRWEEEIAHRLQLPEYRDRKASVELTRTREELRLVITDQGNGFDWQSYLDIDPHRVTHSHGRGIAIANHTSFDTLRYVAPGNRVEATVRLRP